MRSPENAVFSKTAFWVVHCIGECHWVVSSHLTSRNSFYIYSALFAFIFIQRDYLFLLLLFFLLHSVSVTYSESWVVTVVLGRRYDELSKTSNPLTFGFPKLKSAAEVCTLGLSPKYPSWCCLVWAAVNLVLLCSVAFAPHPSCLSCGLFSQARGFESGLLHLLSTPCRTLCTVWLTSPVSEIWPRFSWILGKLHPWALDRMAVVSGSSWPGERSKEMTWRWCCLAETATAASRQQPVPVWLPATLSSGSGKIVSVKKRIIKQN